MGTTAVNGLPEGFTLDPPPTPSPESTNVWQAFPSDDKLADQLMKLEGGTQPTSPPGIRERNNNPGNLKAPGGGFQKFGSWEEGRQALLKQIASFRSGFPDWSIADLNRRWAPDKSHGGDNPEGTEAGRNQHLMNAVTQESQPSDLPAGFTLDPAPTRQVAAGQGAIGPTQVAAGAGATGPGDVLAGLNEYIDKQTAPFWESADRAHDALTTALGHFQDHLKNLAAGVAGIKRQTQPEPTTEAEPPPGFVVEPKQEDFASLPADVRAAQKAGKYLEPAARIVGGMASPAIRASMPYIAWQMYKKATGQPNELNKVPAHAIQTVGALLAGGEGEAAAPKAEVTEAPPKAVPKQLGMGAIEGEYLPPEVRGHLPPGQYAQPPVQQSALPPGQYAPPAPATRLALPERATPIPLPETFPGAREPIIRTTPSEPLPPLRTTPEEAPTKEAPAKKGRAPRAKPAAQPAAKATPEAQPAAERTAVGTEGQVKGMRLVQRGNKWYDARTGEEYKWRVRTN